MRDRDDNLSSMRVMMAIGLIGLGVLIFVLGH